MGHRERLGRLPELGTNVFMQPAAGPTIELGRASSSFSKAWGCQAAYGGQCGGDLPAPTPSLISEGFFVLRPCAPLCWRSWSLPLSYTLEPLSYILGTTRKLWGCSCLNEIAFQLALIPVAVCWWLLSFSAVLGFECELVCVCVYGYDCGGRGSPGCV